MFTLEFCFFQYWLSVLRCPRIKFIGQGFKNSILKNQTKSNSVKNWKNLYLPIFKHYCVNLKPIWDVHQVVWLTLPGFPKVLPIETIFTSVTVGPAHSLTQDKLCKCCEQVLCRCSNVCTYLVILSPDVVFFAHKDLLIIASTLTAFFGLEWGRVLDDLLIPVHLEQWQVVQH